MEQQGTAGTFISNMQKTQKQHPSLRSCLSPSGDGSLKGKKNKETTSWSLGHGQRKPMEMFQPGNKSSQAIKCFTQTPSLTPPWAPCTISHTARLATYKIEASDHKHKKELCFAATHSQHSNRPAPQGGRGFVPVSFRKRFQPANYPRQKWPLRSERGPGDLLQRQTFQESSSFTSCRPLPRMGHPTLRLWVHGVSNVWRVWVLGNPIQVFPGLSNYTLIHCFSRVFFLPSYQDQGCFLGCERKLGQI